MTCRFLPKDTLSTFRKIVRKSVSCSGGGFGSEAQIDRDEQSEIIKSLLCADKSGLPIDAFLRLRKIVDVASYVGKSSPDDLKAAHQIWGIMRSTAYIQPLSSRDNWIKAVKIILGSGTPAKTKFRGDSNSREGVEGQALAELRSRGFDIIVDGLGGRLAPRSYKLACRAIERMIKKAGGLHVASIIFKVMKLDQRLIDGYFSHARRLSHLYEVTQSQTPWNFLYTLALKHIHEEAFLDEPSMFRQEMEKISRAFAASSSFQPHSIYESLNISNWSLEGLILESIAYDEMVAFPQWQGLIAGNLLLDFLECLHERGYIFPKYPLKV